MNTANNTVVTAGDHNYLWGLFLLIASMRQTGMKEPVLVGTKAFTERDCKVLEQLGDVALTSLDHADHSLACHKAEVMLKAETEYVTWADSDALFKGNCSHLLLPPDASSIRVRQRSLAEMPGAFPKGHELRDTLPAWRKDVASVAGLCDSSLREVTPEFIRNYCSCSTCYLSLARSQDRFIRVWHELMMRLPRGNVGVVDRSLAAYHQLDESCLNACLTFLPDAPKITDVYGLDRDPEHIYLHFIGRPKPWEGWTPRGVRHFDAVVSIVEWAHSEKLLLPGEVPFSLRRSSALWSRLFARESELWFKVRRRLPF